MAMRPGNGKNRSSDSSWDWVDVRPYGRFGGGLLTGHPVGLIVIAAILVPSFWRIPAARLFFAGSVALGCVFGFLLWLRHR
jgi:hypothetical protein